MNTENIRDALRPLYVEYRGDVERYARGILEEMPADADREYIDNAIHETADGAEEVIYTFQAQMVALISDNSEAWRDVYGAELPTNSEAAIAYYALRTDIEEALAWLECSCGCRFSDHDDDLECLTPHSVDCERFALEVVKTA